MPRQPDKFSWMDDWKIVASIFLMAAGFFAFIIISLVAISCNP